MQNSEFALANMQNCRMMSQNRTLSKLWHQVRRGPGHHTPIPIVVAFSRGKQDARISHKMKWICTTCRKIRLRPQLFVQIDGATEVPSGGGCVQWDNGERVARARTISHLQALLSKFVGRTPNETIVTGELIERTIADLGIIPADRTLAAGAAPHKVKRIQRTSRPSQW